MSFTKKAVQKQMDPFRILQDQCAMSDMEEELETKGKILPDLSWVAALSEEMFLCSAEKKWHLGQGEANDLAQWARSGQFLDVKGHFISDVQSCSQHCPNGHFSRRPTFCEGKCNHHLEIYHLCLWLFSC